MRKILLTLSVFMLSGCEHNQSFHGSYITPDDMTQVIVGKSKKETVRNILGTPFIMTHKNEWLYISKYEETSPFKSPIEKFHKKYVVSFDNKDIVSKLEVIDINKSVIKFDTNDTRLNKKN